MMNNKEITVDAKATNFSSVQGKADSENSNHSVNGFEHLCTRIEIALLRIAILFLFVYELVYFIIGHIK